MFDVDLLRKVYLYCERYEYYLKHDKAFDDNQVERNMWLADVQRVKEKILKCIDEVNNYGK